MSIAVDSSTPAPTQSNVATGGTIATSAITAPANSLIAICISACSLTGTNGVDPPDLLITGVTGGGLTFSELAYGFQGVSDYASIWCAYGSPAASSTFTAQFGTGYGAGQGCNLVPIVLTGAASTQNGGVATHPAGGNGTGTGGQALESGSATPSVVVAATAAGSLILAVESNFTTSTTPTPAGDQTITFNGNSSMCTLSGNGQWVQMEPTLTTGAGNITISDSAPTGLSIAMCGAEILAATGGGGTLSINLIN